ncbi:sugar phosphate isomerase/epimerase family protein [Larkinella knui]|uniref:Sugar phosphate isomerase/epimerase n=1 Tax=Larkinella knui TaxID=2025310 RepID=A0A3P1CM28_9BACT|nr:sugar phosphate isomerase/epimerase [Larkinella knui]RRB13964.1 sugar phosphate isomerase/epimerase [Larkinella knui]
MSSRREFLKNSGAFALSGLLVPAFARASSLTGLLASAPIGLQLYTITRLMADDPKGTLQKVAAIGYKEIETAGGLKEGYYGFKAKEFKSIVEDLGMKWRAHHAGGAPFRPRVPPSVGGAPVGATPPSAGAPPVNADRQALFAAMAKRPNLRDNYQQLVDEAAEGGLSYLVCASTPVSTVDEINKSIEVFQKTGEACKKAGIAFAYHNHATEFDPVDGAGATAAKTPYELILSQTDKELVKMELDLAWATKAGKDPVALFKEQPGRFPLWHIKDIKQDLKTITEVGNGVVDFKRIFTAAKTAGLKYYFVEQDGATGVENISTSYQNLAKVLA